MRLFDINCSLGDFTFPMMNKNRVTVESLLAEMDYQGIERALVYSSTARKYYPGIGNEELNLNNQERLFGSWVVMPHHTGEMDVPDRLVATMRKQGIKAVRILPATFGFSIHHWSSGKLFSALENNSIPLILGERIDFQEIYDLCHRHPHLDVILSGTFVDAALRNIYPLFAELKNLQMDISGLAAHGAVEEICQKFGAEHLLFGTNYPIVSSSAVISMLEMAEISQEDKEKIGYKNAERILKVSSLPKSKVSSKAAVDMADTFVADVHVHIGPYPSKYQPISDGAETIRVMDLVGINQACVSASMGVFGEDMTNANDYIAGLLKEYPDRFIGMAVLNPNLYRDLPEEIDRCFMNLGMKTVKIHPHLHNCPITDSRYQPVFEGAERYGYPILSHSGYGELEDSPEMFLDLACKYPDVNIIIGHSGNSPRGLEISLEIAKERPNIYLDTSGWAFSHPGAVEYAVEEIGAERIIFGSDFSWIAASYALGIIAHSRLNATEKSVILGKNLRKLLKKSQMNAEQKEGDER